LELASYWFISFSWPISCSINFFLFCFILCGFLVLFSNGYNYSEYVLPRFFRTNQSPALSRHEVYLTNQPALWCEFVIMFVPSTTVNMYPEWWFRMPRVQRGLSYIQTEQILIFELKIMLLFRVELDQIYYLTMITRIFKCS
jgi:hypothetical protein